MPGVNRPQSFVDVISALTGQSDSTTDTSISGVGVIAEADETLPLGDTWTGTVQHTTALWDSGTWGQFTWA